MSSLVAIAGPSRSGKGTISAVFEDIAKQLDITFCERQFSGPGKQYLASAWNPDVTEREAIAWWEAMKGYEGPIISAGFTGPMGINARRDSLVATVSLQQYMQRMLQGARDRWGFNFWTDLLLPIEPSGPRTWWMSQFQHAKFCVISDMRQVNEAQRVKDLGGFVIEMHRPDRMKDGYVSDPNHITEQTLPAEMVDHMIINDGSIEDLQKKAIEIFNTRIKMRL